MVPRFRTEGERLSAGAALFYEAWTEHDPPGTVRARGKLACCASSREKASAVARARVSRESRLRQVEAAAGTSHHDLAPKERVSAGAVPFHRAWVNHNPPWHGSRAREARVLHLLQRESVRSGRCTRVTRKPAAQNGGRRWRVVPRFRTEGERLSAGAVSFCTSWANHDTPGTARASGKLACCASSREAASAVARASVSRESRLRLWRSQLARRTTVTH